ncbi:hypothetical protein BDN70DRAFT_938505 [Pholiota conissans]|uniref:Uncharacterized protein n=1 Tax=Pholiota conissans TaxID=109636 RepID=A0A9P5YQC3_9AGAR|nr:hypothetical protein BDN70DRAFT_938505 [Pholiota conissans]
MPFSWGSPNIEVPAPSANAMRKPVPKTFSSLRFSPQGVFDLRRMHSLLQAFEDGYAENKEQFNASDIAFFAAGCSTNNKNTVGAGGVHPIMESFHREKVTKEAFTNLKERTRGLLFDVAALLDHAFGSSTMVMHVDPTTSPATPISVEDLEAHVYLPPAAIAELPDAHEYLTTTVHCFIANVGLQTKIKWEESGRRFLRWKPSKPRRAASKKIDPKVVPPPLQPGGSVYLFRGRSVPSSAQLLSSASSASLTPSISSASSLSFTDTSDLETLPDTFDDMVQDADEDAYVEESISSSYIAAFDKADRDNERHEYKIRERKYQEQISSLEDELSTIKKRVSLLENELNQRKLHEAAHSPPTFLHSPFTEKLPAMPASSPAMSTVPLVAPAPLFFPSPSPFEPAQVPSPFVSPSPCPTPFVKMPVTPKPKKIATDKSSAIRTKTVLANTPSTSKVLGANGSTFSGKDKMTTLIAQSFPQASIFNPPTPSAPLPVVGASRASLYASSHGYDRSQLAFLELVFEHVDQAFWGGELAKAGFHADDIPDIFKLMVKDYDMKA